MLINHEKFNGKKGKEIFNAFEQQYVDVTIK
jgi:hypothetical protein